MTRSQTVGGAALVGLFALAVGYLLATGYMNYRLNGHLDSIDFLLLPLHLPAIREHLPKDFIACLVLLGAPPVLVLILSTAVLNETLTTFGQRRWQTPGDMKRDGFREEPGYGFLLGKLGSPASRAPFLSSTAFPHAYLTAPTGSGKGVGFVIPNLLTFKGSVVVLDVKGENFVHTSRHRVAMKDKVIRFAPGDFSDKGSHRYNPLARIATLTDPDQQMMELRQTASLFLDSGSSHNDSLLQGGIDIFVACGMLALQRGTLTLGAIHDLAASGGDKKLHYASLANEAQHDATSLLFENLGSINDKTLTSYLSLLMTSGLNAWSNPATQALTATSDFSFADVRRRPYAIYFDVGLGRLAMFAPLIRLFFADLIATLQDHEPGDDEPCPVMIILDEFEQLGRMPSVANSIKTLRSYRGHLALVSQTIPGVDAIYGEDVRLSLQGGSGLQLYYAPSDRKTAEEISHALGRTTKRVITKSSPLGMAPLQARSRSERSEDAALMTEDEVRGLPEGQLLIIPANRDPIRAHRMTYWQDRHLAAIFKAQTGKLPYPPKAPPTPPRAKAVPAPALTLEPPPPVTPPAMPAASTTTGLPPPARPRRAAPVAPLAPRAGLVPASRLSRRVAANAADRSTDAPPAPERALHRARRIRFAPPPLTSPTAKEAADIRVATGIILTMSAMLASDLPDDFPPLDAPADLPPSLDEPSVTGTTP